MAGFKEEVQRMQVKANLNFKSREVLRFISIYNRRKPFDFNFIEEMDLFNEKVIKISSCPTGDPQYKVLDNSDIH
jgi:hypothetical protein